MDLSILIVNWNTRADLLRCLESVYAHAPSVDFEVCVVDNASTDGSAAAVQAQYPQAAVIASPVNLGFARANNLAAAQATGPHLLLLNPDTLVHAGALDRLLGHLRSNPGVAAVGPRLLNPNGSLQISAHRTPTLFREWWRLLHLDRLVPVSQYPRAHFEVQSAQPVDVLNGACLLVRRAALAGARLLDEDYFVYSEEIDLCDRLVQGGWALHWLPAAEVTHLGGQSTRQVADQMFLELYRNKVKFFRKRRGRLSSLIYKLILAQASLPRLVLGALAGALPGRSAGSLAQISRQYRLLLAALPRF